MGVAINATPIEITFDTAAAVSNIENNNFSTPETNATISITSMNPMGPTSPVSPMDFVYVLSERERVRMEFYQTYDVMTGIRIATTLGSFFTLMVLLVLYKSKCKSRADENLEAAITAAVAEEEEMEAVLNHNKYDYSIPCHRQSLGNMSAPACTRFSSLSGYGGLMNPPRRYDRGAKGRISLPASDVSFKYFKSAPTSICSQEAKHPFWRSYNEEEENDLEEIEEIEDNHEAKFLPIPTIQRQKYGSIDYDIEPFHRTRRESNSRQYPENQPNIRVIQPTPQISPSESNSGLLNDYGCDRLPSNVPLGKLAPLASIGSCSAISSMESDRSMGSDSVFLHNDNEDDTDKDQYEEDLSSNRSDHDDCTNKKYRLIASCSRTKRHRFSDPNITVANREDVLSSFPIVTNLASHASNQITTRLYNEMIFESSSNSSSSSTNLSSNYSRSNSTTSEKPAVRRQKGVLSRIAIINVNESPPVKSENEKMEKRFSLSKSEPETMNEPSAADRTDGDANELRTLSLRNLSSKIWNKETLF